MLRSIGKVRGIRGVSPEEEKVGYGGNEGFQPGVKE